MEKKIIIGSDHAGFSLKEILRETLQTQAYEVFDAGCYDANSVHYPDIARRVSKDVAEGNYPRGILVCGTGIGMSIAANRFKKVRATLCNDHLSARMSREHNDSNILVLGGRVLGVETAHDILETWLRTEFLGGRHLERINMVENDGYP
ncbi:MAG: ribose 5-phosphate isomerase B [Proteobacteria bacterium]|nr:ribose 5-phosphate isomerase B [Pseudomonadota bacterium]